MLGLHMMGLPSWITEAPTWAPAVKAPIAPMAGIDPTLRAWAGGDLEADQPRVRHFHLLEETSDFLSAAGGGRGLVDAYRILKGAA